MININTVIDYIYWVKECASQGFTEITSLEPSQGTETTKKKQEGIKEDYLAFKETLSKINPDAFKHFCLLLKIVFPSNHDFVMLFGETSTEVVSQLQIDYETLIKEQGSYPNNAVAQALKSSGYFVNNHGFNYKVYSHLIPLCNLAFAIENNGVPIEHAYKLSVAFGNFDKILEYFKKSTVLSLHDACLFTLPSESTWTVEIWRELALKENNRNVNLANKDFRIIFANAGNLESYFRMVAKEKFEELEKINHSIADLKKRDDIDISNKEQKLSELKKAKYNCIALEKILNFRQAPHLKPLQAAWSQYIKTLSDTNFEAFFVKIDISLLKEKYLEISYKKASENRSAAELFLCEGLKEENFDLYLSLKPQDNNIPDVSIILNPSFKNYYLKKLSSFDPRAAILGKLTDCCQSLDNQGASCTIHGITSPDGGFYVICKAKRNEPKDDDEIVSQCWAWRSKTGAIVFDSIESLQKTAKGAAKSETGLADPFITNEDVFSSLYQALANKLVNNCSVPKVMVGIHGQTPKGFGFAPLTLVEEIPIDYSGYRDSETQHILAIQGSPIGNLLNQKLKVGFNQNEDEEKIRAFIDQFPQSKKLISISIIKDWINVAIQNSGEENLTILRSFLGPERSQEFDALIDANKKMFALCQEPTGTLDIRQVESLVKQGAEINFSHTDSGRTLFTTLLMDSQNFEKIKKLQELGANLNAADNQGATSLLLAARANKWDAVKYLIGQPGINLDIVDFSENTVLFMAIKANQLKVVKLLAKHPNINLNAKNSSGHTALLFAADAKKWGIVAILAQQPKIDLNTKDACGNTILSLAAEAGSLMVVRLLSQQQGINLNAKSQWGGVRLET